MAVVPYALIYPTQDGANRSAICTWGIPTAVANPGNGLGNTPRPFKDLTGGTVEPAVTTYVDMVPGDTGEALYAPALGERTVQITVANGGQVTILGSNDGVNYFTLSDVLGSPLASVAVSGIWHILEQTAWIKPQCFNGGTANVVLVGKRHF
jgi:hypothetical protein